METNIQKHIAFLKTVEYGSFTKASEVLNYSQSGISRMIHDLEIEWGMTLIERRKSGIQLTSEGLEVLPIVKALCDQFDQLQNHINDMNGLQTGLIRIGTFSSVATHWLPKIIKAFQKDYPQIDYELVLGDYREIESWIQSGRVDCGFLRLPTQTSLDTTLLAQDDLLVILPVGHPLTKYNKIPPHALSDYPFLLLERDGQGDIGSFFKDIGVGLDVQLQTWEDYAIMAMVEGGLGISILPELMLKRVPYQIEVRPLTVPLMWNIAIAVKDGDKLSLATKYFMNYLNYRNE